MLPARLRLQTLAVRCTYDIVGAAAPTDIVGAAAPTTLLALLHLQTVSMRCARLGGKINLHTF
jgi:hypothetical protein